MGGRLDLIFVVDMQLPQQPQYIASPRQLHGLGLCKTLLEQTNLPDRLTPLTRTTNFFYPMDSQSPTDLNSKCTEIEKRNYHNIALDMVQYKV